MIAAIARGSAGWTGYTHQWANPLKAGYKRYLMASVESDETLAQAQNLGWRTFRVAAEGKLERRPNEIVCVNTTHGTTCADCGLCNGGDTRKKSIVIEVHGIRKNRLAA